jgi:hypothetical protein
VPTLYNISGSSDFFNMTQNGFTVYRNFSSGKTEVHFQKVKWEHLGKLGMVEYTYHEDNSRFYDNGNEDPNINWLKKSQHQQAVNFYEPNKGIEPSTQFEDPPF